ncbi:hypothetical protein ACI7RC_13460 [Brevibacillus sp. B_LB10_24]|uniref:hypothetical protein n=1 Tax=Brevibacillus sp. B_LB10_24 TaxID=3380645 RepID=UPI0038BA271F
MTAQPPLKSFSAMASYILATSLQVLILTGLTWSKTKNFSTLGANKYGYLQIVQVVIEKGMIRPVFHLRRSATAIRNVHLFPSFLKVFRCGVTVNKMWSSIEEMSPAPEFFITTIFEVYSKNAVGKASCRERGPPFTRRGLLELGLNGKIMCIKIDFRRCN